MEVGIVEMRIGIARSDLKGAGKRHQDRVRAATAAAAHFRSGGKGVRQRRGRISLLLEGSAVADAEALHRNATDTAFATVARHKELLVASKVAARQPGAGSTGPTPQPWPSLRHSSARRTRPDAGERRPKLDWRPPIPMEYRQTPPTTSRRGRGSRTAPARLSPRRVQRSDAARHLSYQQHATEPSTMTEPSPYCFDMRLALRPPRRRGTRRACRWPRRSLSGLAPALQASKGRPSSGLRNDPGIVGRLRLRSVFVLGQVAFSVVLVICAGLFMRALHRAGLIHPGFDPHGVDSSRRRTRPRSGYTETTGALFARELPECVRGFRTGRPPPLGNSLPGGFEVWRETMTVAGTPPASERAFTVDWNIVESEYFVTPRTAIVSGRDFSIGDRRGTDWSPS